MIGRDFLDQIKATVDFPSLVGQLTTLKRWPNGTGAVKALCPFHDNTKTPALAVYHDHATCFGACQTTWDIFSWIQQRDQCNFVEAVRTAADLAGLTMPDDTPEQQAKWQQIRRQRDVLTAAAQYYQRQLVATRHDQDSAYQYAKGRGWSLKTIGRAKLGYAPDDLAGFLVWLDSQQITHDQAISAGLLGTSKGRAYLRFRNRLMFPFWRGGACVYLTGRDLTGRPDYPKWFHLPADQRPLYGQDQGTGPLVVVESPADVLTLFQLGRQAVAALGLSLPAEAVAKLAKHAPVYLALDPDRAGQGAMAKVAQDLGPATRVVSLPGGDCNSIHQAEGGQAGAIISQALTDSPTWVEYCAQVYKGAGPDEQPQALERFLTALGALTPQDLALLRGRLADLAGMTQQTLKELLKTTAKDDPETWAPSISSTYRVVNGALCRMTSNGPRTLANFAATITNELRLDNGDEITTEYQIAGATESGLRLPVARVPAADYNDMSWIDQHWGVSAVVAPGKKADTAAAIKLLSQGAETMNIFTHSGWREIRGQRCFLHSAGALGYKGQDQIRVDLGQLDQYSLPEPAPADTLAEAIRASLGYWDIADRRVSLPLWAAMYQAPLGSLLAPRMVLWCHGPTNTFKSTALLLVMRHFGRFTAEGDFLSWASTDNAIELAGYMLKDLPLVVDDYAHQPNHYQQKKLEQVAERVIRSAGNQAGRWRMAKTQKHRTTTTIRALIISTGETLPNVQPSATARLLPLRFTRQTVNLDQLTHAQAHQADQYSQAMAGYLVWLANNWATVSEKIKPYFEAHRQKAREKSTGATTARLTDAISRNCTAFAVAMEYAQAAGAISAQEAADARAEHWENLLQIASDQDKEVKEQDPVKRFCQLLSELFQSNRAWLCPVHVTDPLEEDHLKPTRAEKIGWVDDTHYWLIFDSAYGMIQRTAAQAGYALTFSPREIKGRLYEAGILVKGAQNRWVNRLQAVEGRPYLVKLDRGVFSEFT